MVTIALMLVIGAGHWSRSLVGSKISVQYYSGKVGLLEAWTRVDLVVNTHR